MVMGIRRALALIWEAAPGWTVANAVLMILQGLLPLASLYLMKLLIDAVTVGASASDKAPVLWHVGLLVGLAGGASLLGVICNSVSGLISEAQAERVTDRVQDLLHAKSIEVDLAYYETPDYHDALHRAQQEAPYRPARIVNGLVRIAQSGITLAAMAGLLLSFHWGVVAVLAIASLPTVLVRLTYARRTYRLDRAQTPDERQAWYHHLLITGDPYAKEVRLFGLGPLFIQRYRRLREQLRGARLRIARRRTVAQSIGEAAATGAVFTALGFIAFRMLGGAITLGGLVMYFLAFQRGQAAIQQVLTGIADLYQDNLFLTSLYEFLDLRRTVIEPIRARPVPRPMRTGIAFDHVSFRYPPGGRRVLNDINLGIRPGEHVAFVGANGAGKTTLVKLLCRLYDPDEGRITLDGVDLRDFETAALRREIGVIFQDYARYNVTGRENVWFGNVDVSPDDARVVAAARSAGADDVLRELPDGYETLLGKWFEGGEELSAGQWQKIALARAFLRDAQMIVLDEPTSAMDAQSEQELFQRFHDLAEGRMAVIISHRFSTVRMADRIVVLEAGGIVDMGSHAELLQHGGKYAHLFEIQAQHYR